MYKTFSHKGFIGKTYGGGPHVKFLLRLVPLMRVLREMPVCFSFVGGPCVKSSAYISFN